MLPASGRALLTLNDCLKQPIGATSRSNTLVILNAVRVSRSKIIFTLAMLFLNSANDTHRIILFTYRDKDV